MKTRIIIPAGIILLCLSGILSAQSKKMIREKGIVKQTVYEYFLEEGMDKPVVEQIERYNEDGELIEVQEFNKLGEVQKWEKYAYDDEGNLVEEIFLDEKGKATRTEKSIYKDGLRVEKQFFDERGRMFKKKEYLYEYR
jgi:YD repeat-containing protein